MTHQPFPQDSQQRRQAAIRNSSIPSHYLFLDVADWTWRELRDYVVRNIIEMHGPFESNSITEAAIFKSFMKRYGDEAPQIARFVFEMFDGMWYGSPVTVNSFCKAADPTFAEAILRIMKEATA